MRLQIVGLALLLGLGACAQPKTMYTWSGYSGHLLGYYKNSYSLEQYSQKLRESIEEAEAKGKVPPGIYAEYGYALLEAGNSQQAMVYFTKESEAWPESAVFMGKIIGRLQAAPSQPEAATSADAQGAAAQPMS